MSKRRPSGDGMVRKKEDGRWEGRIVIGHKENGDSIFRYIYAPTQKELTAKLRQEITAYQGVDLTEDSKLTLSEWLDYWLDAIMAGTIRPSTLNGYRRYADLYTHHNNRAECETVAASGYPHGFGSNLTVFTVTDLERISEKAVANWENSPGHLATMIDPNYDTVGVGVTIDNGRAFCYMFVGNPTAHNPHA